MPPKLSSCSVSPRHHHTAVLLQDRNRSYWACWQNLSFSLHLFNVLFPAWIYPLVQSQMKLFQHVCLGPEWEDGVDVIQTELRTLTNMTVALETKVQH